MIITQAQDWAVNHNDSIAMPYNIDIKHIKMIFIVAVFGAKPRLSLNLFNLQSKVESLTVSMSLRLSDV